MQNQLFCKFRNIYSFNSFNCTNFWIFAHEYLIDIRYKCRMINMIKLIVSWIDVSNLFDLNFWQSKFDSHCFEFWIFYTRFFLNIEIFWNNVVIKLLDKKSFDNRNDIFVENSKSNSDFEFCQNQLYVFCD